MKLFCFRKKGRTENILFGGSQMTFTFDAHGYAEVPPGKKGAARYFCQVVPSAHIMEEEEPEAPPEVTHDYEKAGQYDLNPEKRHQNSDIETYQAHAGEDEVASTTPLMGPKYKGLENPRAVAQVVGKDPGVKNFVPERPKEPEVEVEEEVSLIPTVAEMLEAERAIEANLRKEDTLLEGEAVEEAPKEPKAPETEETAEAQEAPKEEASEPESPEKKTTKRSAKRSTKRDK